MLVELSQLYNDNKTFKAPAHWKTLSFATAKHIHNCRMLVGHLQVQDNSSTTFTTSAYWNTFTTVARRKNIHNCSMSVEHSQLQYENNVLPCLNNN
jgi:hypothetical protein